MPKWIARNLVIALVFVLSAVAPAWAQDDTHGVLGIGASLLAWSDYSSLGKGFTFDLAHPVGPDHLRLRGVGDFGFWKEFGETDVTVLGGVRHTIPIGERVDFEIQGLIGVAYFESFGQGYGAFAGGPGAALRVWIKNRLGVKVQADYLFPTWNYGRLYRTWVALTVGLPPG